MVRKSLSKQDTLRQRVLNLIREYCLIPTGETLVIGVSGGADSVCLLHILAGWREELGLKLHVAHLNHQLRGAESDADASYVCGLAERLDIPVTVERRDVAAYRRGKHCSLEEAARELRYSFFVKVTKKVGTHRLAIGHTRDDQVETILMHLLRGTGTAGLRGLQPSSSMEYREAKWHLTLIRPLLNITREETTAYCWEHQLAPRSDSSNVSLSFLRNRLRLELLPFLRNYNPNIDETLLRLANIADGDVSFIEEQASRLWAEVARREGGVIYLDKRKITRLPGALQRQLLKLAIAQLLGDVKNIEANHIEAMVGLITKPAGKRLYLPRELVFLAEYDQMVLAPDSASLCSLPVIENKFQLNIPGETTLPGWRVRASIFEGRVVEERGGFIASFDFDRAGSQLIARQRQWGDQFQPLGMAQPKKLYGFMVDAKIPRAWRDRIPIVCSPERILWVVGWRIDDRVKVTESTKRILHLEFDRLL